MPKNLIRSSNYWTLNKTLVQKLGIETAFLLTNLIEAEHMMKAKDGWFFQTIEKLEKVSTLSRYKQEKCIEKLREEGLIDVEVKGLPAKRYFRINNQRLSEFVLGENKVVNISQTGVKKNNKQVRKKLATSKESIYKESNYKSSSSNSAENPFEFYEQNFGMISPFIAENIEKWVEDLSDELVVEAMKLSLKANKQFNYAEGIMRSWLRKNIKTLDDVRAAEVEFENNRSNKSKQKSVDEIDWDNL